MKKLMTLLICALLTLSACAPKFNQEEKVVQEIENKKQKAIIPKYNISNSYYRTILPFQPGEARGLIVENVNTRLDMEEFELGLMRIAQEKFSPSQYLFQQGQYLDRKTIESWLKRKQGNGEGLNPALRNEGTNAEKNKKSQHQK